MAKQEFDLQKFGQALSEGASQEEAVAAGSGGTFSATGIPTSVTVEIPDEVNDAAPQEEPAAQVEEQTEQPQEEEPAVASATTEEQGEEEDPLLNSIMDFLNESTDVISSEETELDSFIDDIISERRAGQESSEEAIKAGAERKRREITELAEERTTAAREAFRGGGPASQMALVQRLEEQTRKEVKDLDLREQQLLAEGRSDLADEIANLKIQKLQFLEKQKQQRFSNMLNTGQFALGVQQQEAQEEQNEFSRELNKLNVLNELGLVDQMSDKQKRKFEASLGLSEGQFDKIKPRANERFLFQATDQNNNVTAVFQDQLTGDVRSVNLGAIGIAPQAGGAGLTGSERTNLEIRDTINNFLSSIQDPSPQDIERGLVTANGLLTFEGYIESARRFAVQFSARPGVGDPIERFKQLVPSRQFVAPEDQDKVTNFEFQQLSPLFGNLNIIPGQE